MVSLVLNVRTGEIWTFLAPPAEAVRNAFCIDQTRGFGGILDLLPVSFIVKEDERMFYAGDFCTLKR